MIGVRGAGDTEGEHTAFVPKVLVVGGGPVEAALLEDDSNLAVQVARVQSWVEALVRMKQDRFEVAVIRSGPAATIFLDEVRRLDPDCGVVVVTRNGDPVSSYLRRGAIAGISEPIDPAQIRRVIADVLAGRRSGLTAEHYLERIDPVTGLPGIWQLERSLEVKLAWAARRSQAVALALFELEMPADPAGRPSEERKRALLHEIGRVLRARAPAGAEVTRYAGAAFALVLPGRSREEAVELVETLLTAMPAPMRVGVAGAPEDGIDPGSLLAAAERALGQAGSAGAKTAVVSASARPWRSRAEMEILESLATMIDAKEFQAPGHSGGVAEVADQLARRLALGSRERQCLKVAALLHDLGKIGVPEAILRKQGPLTPEEREIVQRHPYFACLLLKQALDLQEVLAAIYHHHERYDGAGYPTGLAGEEIPLLARILCVADSYCAMVADRPYRRRLSAEEAREELRRNAGSQFDPELVGLLLAELEAGAELVREAGRTASRTRAPTC